MTPEGLAAYIQSYFGIQLGMEEALNLCVRMNSTFFGMQNLFNHMLTQKQIWICQISQKRPTFESIIDHFRRRNSVIQMISELATPIACKLRCMVAWDKLVDEGVVQTPNGVFETLCSLDILQVWFDEDEIPSDDEIREVLEKMPSFLEHCDSQ